MKEIGGYFELENFTGQEYYPDLLKFNLARTAIAWFLTHAGCKRLYLPVFICASVTSALENTGIEIIRYPINADFTPLASAIPMGPLTKDTWIFINNSYGQLSNSLIANLKEKYGNIFLDFTHAFFQAPLPGIAAVCSVRKFFGVTDGAYLQSDRPFPMPEKIDKSYARFDHVLGRYEAPAGEFYQMMLDNAHSYEGANAKCMSRLTENFLKAIDYRSIASQRMMNFFTLSKMLDEFNGLAKKHILRTPDVGPFVYPFLVNDGIAVRKALADEKIFVPTYWKEVADKAVPSSVEYNYAANILALPCDQRYDEKDMMRVARTVISVITR